jgi:hypothetical protein
MDEFELPILNSMENVASISLRKIRSTAVDALLASGRATTISLSFPTVVKSTPQPIDPNWWSKPDVPTAAAHHIREKIRAIIALELTIGQISDVLTSGSLGQ